MEIDVATLRQIFNLYVVNEYTLIGFKDFAEMFDMSEEKLSIIMRDFYNRFASPKEKEILKARFKERTRKRDKIKDAIMDQDIFNYFLKKKDYDKTLEYALNNYGRSFTRITLSNRIINFYKIASIEEKKKLLLIIRTSEEKVARLFINLENEIFPTQDIIQELFKLYINGLTRSELKTYAEYLKISIDELSQILIDYYFNAATEGEKTLLELKLKETPSNNYDTILTEIKRKSLMNYFLTSQELEKTLNYSNAGFGFKYTKYSLARFLIKNYESESKENQALFINAASNNKLMTKQMQYILKQQ